MAKNYKHISIKPLPNCEIEIKGEIEASAFDTHLNKVIENKIKKVEMPGFRKGKVPRDIVIKEFGETFFLDAAAEEALNEAYPSIAEEHKLRIIGRPKVTLTKLAKGNPLGFTIITAVMPELDLPPYKKIAADTMKEVGDFSVTHAEIENVILEIR